MFVRGWDSVEIKNEVNSWPFLLDTSIFICKNNIEILVNNSIGLCLDTVY